MSTVLSSVAACVKISGNLNLVERRGREWQVGGGCGLELGKERVRQMITSFGGRVTSAVSGKTDLVIVGKEPGFSKVDPRLWPSTAQHPFQSLDTPPYRTRLACGPIPRAQTISTSVPRSASR